MSVLVTGGAGFIGTHVCERFLAEGEETICFDLISPLKKMETSPKHLKIEIGDLTSFRDITKCIKRYKPGGIVSMGAILPPRDILNPIKTFEVNVGGLINILEAARIFELDKIIFISTAGVYGKRPDLNPISEETDKHPETLYENSKWIGEQLCQFYTTNYNVDIGVIRYPFIYGPRQDLVWPLNILLYHALTGKVLDLPQGGDYVMDYTYVKDAAYGTVLAYRSPALSHLAYNLGSGRLTSVKEIAGIITQIFPKFKYKIGPGIWSDETFNVFMRGYLEIERAKSDFHYIPQYPLKKGITDYIDWLHDHPSEYQLWPKNELWLL